MKWKNRLQAVLTQGAKNENSKECLKTPLRITAESPNSLVFAVIRSDEFRHFPKKTDELADIKSEKLHEILNRFIADGVRFEVSDDGFQIIDSNQNLKASDKEFLKLNDAAILCQLQQSLLTKHLFSLSPELIEDFAFEIEEREALMAINNDESFPSQSEAVRDVSKNWFNYLLSED